MCVLGRGILVLLISLVLTVTMPLMLVKIFVPYFMSKFYVDIKPHSHNLTNDLQVCTYSPSAAAQWQIDYWLVADHRQAALSDFPASHESMYWYKAALLGRWKTVRHQLRHDLKVRVTCWWSIQPSLSEVKKWGCSEGKWTDSHFLLLCLLKTEQQYCQSNPANTVLQPPF